MATPVTIKSEGQGRIFRNPVLEALTKTNPVIHVVTYGSIVTGLLVVSFGFSGLGWPVLLLTFGAGLLFWSLFEYIMHRWLFHWAGESRIMQRVAYIAHGIHHEYPRDEERVFMPPAPGFLAVSALLGIFYLPFGAAAFSFLPGMVLGYMTYSLMHYSMHHLKPPHFLERLWRHHNIHHYRYPDKAFGVSSMLWDRVFGTMPPKQQQGRLQVSAAKTRSKEKEAA